jgi:RNA polymerase sigma-70 factor (ECF subfamily)
MEHRPLRDFSESDLVRLAQERNQDAFAELMQRNATASFRLALSILKNRQEAEDEVQTSFLKAWVSLPLFKAESKFSTWFRTIVHNQSLMSLRKARRATLTSLDEPQEDGRTREVAGPEPGPEVALSQNQLSRHLKTEVQRLPPLLREVLVLRDLEQVSTEEAATRLGISEAAVKSRLMRARGALRERMERHTVRSSGASA